MQANTNDRFLNMRIFAELLRCIREICAERLIGHLAMVDLGDESQSWFRDFFRLAGFRRCRCQGPARGAPQPEPRNCLASKGSLERDCSTACERLGAWLAQGRCTRALFESVASGEAADVERRYFRDLLAELKDEKEKGDGKVSHRVGARTGVTARMRRHRSWPNVVRRLAGPRRAGKPEAGFSSLRKARFSQDTGIKSMRESACRVVKKRKWSGNTDGRLLA